MKKRFKYFKNLQRSIKKECGEKKSLVIIKKIGVLSLAKIQGLIMAIIGLIIGLLSTSLTPLIGGAGATIAGIGLGAIILFPILYGIIGFVGGALGAWLYNTVVGVVGGIEIELEE